MVLFQWVAAVDLVPNEEAHANVLVTETSSWVEQDKEVSAIHAGATYCIFKS